jgi:RHS repeat-associated protein
LGSNNTPLAESDLSGTIQSEYIFSGGNRVARLDVPSATVHYYFSDHLGSTSVTTDAAGAIKDESDYYPYGGEIVISDADTNHYKFTSKERDSESGLDFFGKRYYSAALGRWMTADTGASHLLNPQKWNLYAYALNNPILRIDPDGADDVVAVHKLATATARFWLQENEEFDAAAMIASISGVETLKWKDSVAHGQSPHVILNSNSGGVTCPQSSDS